MPKRPNPNLSNIFSNFKEFKPKLTTNLGLLFNVDCLKVLTNIKDNTVDTIFADPPFNLNKDYGKKVKDDLLEEEYLTWCFAWIDECIRILKPGGSFFLYNIPKWNIPLGHRMGHNLLFRHWITISMKNSLPIANKLYPAHYSMLYYTKGKPTVFNKIRTPIETCRHCGKDLKDYGGHKKSLHADGISLTDVWTDVSPVRHRKFKSTSRKANQLSSKILSRVISMSTNPGDLVLDPFGGSGTTFSVCEQTGRKWIGTELGDCSSIIERLTTDKVKEHTCDDVVEA